MVRALSMRPVKVRTARDDCLVKVLPGLGRLRRALDVLWELEIEHADEDLLRISHTLDDPGIPCWVGGGRGEISRFSSQSGSVFLAKSYELT